MLPLTDHRLAWCSLRVAALCAFLSCSPSSGQQAQPTRGLPAGPGNGATTLESTKGELNSSISVAGRIVDDIGHPVSDVNLEVRTYSFDPLARDFLGESLVTRRASGEFAAECRACQSMRLVFWKDGFLGCTLDYYVGGSATTPVRPVNLRTEVAVLRRLETLARFALFEGQMTVALADEFDVMVPEISTEGWRGPVRAVRTASGIRLAGQRRRTSAGELHESVVTAPFVALGNQESFGGTVGSSPERQLDGLVRAGRFSPAGVYLWNTDPQGGFVVFTPRQPKVGEPSPDVVAREMNTCPDSGYVSSIPLASDGAYTFFFCKIGRWFGKGYVAGLLFKDPRFSKEPVANVRLALNPDGTRNVAGIPW